MSAPQGYPGSVPSKGPSVLGIISLIFGVMGLPVTFIPCLGILALPLVIIGLVLGMIGYFVSKSSQRTGTGLDIAGMSVNGAGLFIALAWIGVFVIIGRNEAAKQAAIEKSMREDPAIAVTAIQLSEQYEHKQAEADAKYKDQILEVSGFVNTVTLQELFDMYTVTLRGEADGEPLDIDCDFKKKDETRKMLEKLKPGYKIVVRGKCIGKSALGRVTLETCVVK